MPSLQTSAKRVLKAFGVRAQRWATPSFDWEHLFERLKERGFLPDTIIDVGVGWGTPELYDAFPKASYILVEPLREFEPALQALSKKLGARIIRAAAGAAAGKATMYVQALASDSTWFAEGADNTVASYEVDVVRLDQVIEVSGRTVLLKIDVQGAELHVMEGCAGVLDKIDMVIVETNLIAVAEPPGGEFGVSTWAELAEVVAYMKRKGFVVYDIIGGVYRPLDRALAQVDLVFVPERHLLRRDRRWHSQAPSIQAVRAQS